MDNTFHVPKVNNAQIDWQPTASLEALHLRARVYQKIRAFFAARDVLEFESPLLCRFGVTDPHTQNIAAGDFFLQSSPEYAMKRAVAAWRKSIFQICKAFRQEEHGNRHRCEFTLLEWYRVGFDHHQLMDEVNALLQNLLACQTAERYCYQAIFRRYLKLDPLYCTLDNCLDKLAEYKVDLSSTAQITTKDTALALLMSHLIEPQLGKERPVFIYDYPSTQAALAKTDPKNPLVAQRFEVYINGIELANGFNELTDANEQKARFLMDQQQRQQQGLPAMEIDPYLLAALEHGLPKCAGIALGIDRLLMLMHQTTEIRKVISFDTQEFSGNSPYNS